MKFLHRFVFVLAITCITVAGTTAQVVVNEFCTANYSDWVAGAGQNEDWIELYNPTGAAVNVGGYWLSNRISNPQKWQIPNPTNIGANSYLIILLSGTGAYDPNFLGYQNTNFRVTQTGGDQLVFSNSSGTILESFDIPTTGAFQANHSWGRIADGGSTWAIHSNPSQGATNSGTTYASYTPTPILNIQAGYKTGPINVTITAEPGATIYYTTNGNEPTNASTIYTGPIAISTTTTLRAIAYSADPTIWQSLIETNTYFFGADQHNVYTVNVSGATLSDGTWGWGGDENTHIEFFSPAGTFLAEATGDSNEHGNDSNAYPQKGFDYITRDAMGYDNEVELAIFHSSTRPSYERLIFKAAANDNFPSSDGAHIRDSYVHKLSIIGGLNLDERDTESCIVYINGAYWGVYDVREKADDTDYTKYYYNQPDGFIDFIKTWGGTWNEYGSNADWNTLVAFITGNDMTVQANYDYVLTQYNHMSLIDYFILNGYTVCTDWLNWNTAWWRGRHPNGSARKWKYVLWDNDATFGHYVNYTGVPSTQPTADPCQIEDMDDVGGQGHVPVLNALFNNQNFLADYVQRYASLSNSIFSCESMNIILDSMIAEFEPEMARHCARWGGTVATWQANVEALRTFINARCNTEIIGGISDCYNVTPYNVTIQIDGVGEIEFETLYFNNDNTPFTGVYFADLPINLDALVEDAGCGSFTSWEIVSGTGVIANPNDPQTTMTISSDVTLVAHFSEPATGPVVITSNMSLAGAGTITVNGALQPTYPFNSQVEPGSLVSLTATTNEWFVFDHWESVNSTISPNENDTSITITPCHSDSIIAVYTAIDHFTLHVNLGPQGGGIVVMNGDTVPAGGLTLDLLGSVNYSFGAYPNDQWSVFDHWEINGITITPDQFNANVILFLTQSGSITAVFTLIPHHTVTVVVEPLYAGAVTFEEEHVSGTSYVTNSSLTVVLEGDKPLQFDADANDYWYFKNWTSNFAAPNPSDDQPTARFSFMYADTVFAHFVKEPFSVYIPNSFSPNNDGTNDVFRVEGNAIDPNSYHLMIFDRWGEKVFESNDMNKVWVGSFQGGEYYVNESFYQYVLKVKSVHETDQKVFAGSIYLLR